MKCGATKVVKAAGYLVNWQDCLSFPFYAVLRKKKERKKEGKKEIKGKNLLHL
jgi:hypothetical protein